MSKIHVAVAAWNADSTEHCKVVEDRLQTGFTLYSGRGGVLAAYQQAYEQTEEPLIAYVHDDVEVYEADWVTQVEQVFKNRKVGVVGFGGAKRHGRDDLYKRPYRLTDLARADYWSNTTDAEQHGSRLSGETEVVVLDGFCMVVRREVLDGMKGWEPDLWPPHHVYDYRLCAEARRQGYRIMALGVSCQHLGGRTATTPEFQEWCKSTKWGSDLEMHRAGHRMFYEEYRDVMPARCK